MRQIQPDEIDALLPQTQCGLCGYGGCMPYAKAIAHENAPIHLCPPGGIKTLKALGELIEEDPTPYFPEMAAKAKPPMLAVIREAECIGCTKCIKACPVDAIVGSAKQMHTILASECTGCELCVPPCPVDCIDMIPLPQPEATDVTKRNYFRQRFLARQKRLADEKPTRRIITPKKPSLIDKKNYIKEAIERAKNKKMSMHNIRNESR